MAVATPTTNTAQTLYAPAAPQSDTNEVRGGRIWGVLRLSIGWVFLWAFLDKLLALGFARGATPRPGSRTASATPPGSMADPRPTAS